MTDRIYLNLRLFDTVVNKTTSNTTGNDLSPEMRTFYSDYLIDIAEPNLVHDQFGQKVDIPRNGGKTVQFRKYSQLPKATTPLVEGVTPNGQALNVTTITATVAQYGNFIMITDLLDLTAVDNNLVEATRLLGGQAGRTLDTITREVLNGGTNVIFGDGSVNTRAAVTSAMKLTVDVVKRAIRQLKVQNAPTMDDGYYVGIVHPDTEYDLTNDTAWVEANKYTTDDHRYISEIGKIGTCRFVESTEAKIFAGAGASGIDVYSTLILGADAYGTTKVEGGGLETIVKQLGSAGTADPLNQRATVGWKATKTAERLVEEYMVRCENASTFNSGAN